MSDSKGYIMKISGEVVFHNGHSTHNQATFEGVSTISDVLAGVQVSSITNCFLIAESNILSGATVDFSWSRMRNYLEGNNLFASISPRPDNKEFGYMKVEPQGVSSTDGAAKLTCTVYFPADQSNIPMRTIFYLVLVMGGNIQPYTGGGYIPNGFEKVLAVLNLNTTPIQFIPLTDNDFTWTLYIAPVPE